MAAGGTTDASARMEPAGLGTQTLDVDRARAAGGCHDDGTTGNGEGSGIDAVDDESIGRGLGVKLGPSQMTGVGVGEQQA